jgi:5-bromo-4-chloroindolyl phosphate hydrolysis protein
MALKDWKKEVNMENMQQWRRRNTKSFRVTAWLHSKNYALVDIRGSELYNDDKFSFKSLPKALKFAKDYMKKH